MGLASLVKMMCDIMPPISEDPPEIHYGQNEETNFEQLMVNMLDERDKLMETLRETQDSLSLTRAKLSECQKEKDALMEHLENVLSQVDNVFCFSSLEGLHVISCHSLFTQVNRPCLGSNRTAFCISVFTPVQLTDIICQG